MRILVFLHDTTIMHRSGLGVSRRERVAQGRQKDPSVRDYASYVPIGLAATKLHRWERQGAKVIYLSSHTSWDDVQKDFAVLRKHDFPLADIAYRCGNKQYGDVADELGPDLVVEDDCESIGGEPQMTYPQMGEAAKSTAKSILVKEFEGIDALPADLGELVAHARK